MDPDDMEYTDEEILEILDNAEANWRWIDERREELAKRYPYQYICVHKQRIVASGGDIKEVLASVPDEPDMVCEYIATYIQVRL